MMRQPLDLFKFFTVVRERGGLQEVSFIKQGWLKIEVSFIDVEFCRNLVFATVHPRGAYELF